MPNELKLGEGGGEMKADHRLGVGVRGREGRRTNDEAGIRAVELQSDFQNDTNLSGR